MAKILPAPLPYESTGTTTGGTDRSAITPPLLQLARLTSPRALDLMTNEGTNSNGSSVPRSLFSPTVPTPIAVERTPRTARLPADPMRVANPDAPSTMTSDDFSGLVSNGRVDVSTLTSDPEIRRLAGEGDLEALTKAGRRASMMVPATMLRALHLSAAESKRFQLEGVSALTDTQRQTLNDALADRRMGQLRALAGASGVIDGARADRLFAWIDNFDTNGHAGSIGMVEPKNSSRLTPSGRVMQRVLERVSSTTSFTERDFVAGFRNGVIDADAVRNDPSAREALRKLGILEMLEQRTAAGTARLTVAQARTLFRAIDRVDKNGSADSVAARYGSSSTPDGAFPFDVAGNDSVTATPAGEGIAALNAVFRSSHVVGEGEERPIAYDVPPPSPTDTGDPLSQTVQRLSERPTVDRESFRDSMRDARINLDAITGVDREGLARAGLTLDELRRIAAPNGTIGGPNAEMAQLYELLRAKQGGRGGDLVVYSGGNGSFTATRTGQALQILERYTTRYDLTTAERMRQDLAGQRVDLSALDAAAPGAPGKTVREQLETLGFDASAFEKWVRGAGNRAVGATAAVQIYGMICSMGDYNDPRPGTVSLSSLTMSARGPTSTPTQAGRILSFLQGSGVLKVSDQAMKSYATADGAMLAPPGTRPVSLPFVHYVMRGQTDCLQRAIDTVASKGGRRVRTDGRGTWFATGSDALGRISASAGDLAAARSYIDASLDDGDKVIVGVSRLGAGHKNRDRATKHFVAIVGRGVDERGRLYYAYADSGSSRRFVGRFYVDPQTQLLYAPVDTAYTVMGGGYQVTHVRAFADGNFDREFQLASGGIAPSTAGLRDVAVARATRRVPQERPRKQRA